jgi:hypothetical protein
MDQSNKSCHKILIAVIRTEVEMILKIVIILDFGGMERVNLQIAVSASSSRKTVPSEHDFVFGRDLL